MQPPLVYRSSVLVGSRYNVIFDVVRQGDLLAIHTSWDPAKPKRLSWGEQADFNDARDKFILSARLNLGRLATHLDTRELTLPQDAARNERRTRLLIVILVAASVATAIFFGGN